MRSYPYPCELYQAGCIISSCDGLAAVPDIPFPKDDDSIVYYPRCYKQQPPQFLSEISEEEFTRAKRGDFIGKSEMLQIQSPGNETQEIHMPPQAIKGKDNANDRRRRRGSGLKGSRTERMVEQLAEFKAWLRDNPVNERIAARTVGARASTYWRLHEKTFAKDATRTGEKRGFSSSKTLASAYRNSKR